VGNNRQKYDAVETRTDRAIEWIRRSPWTAVIVAGVIIAAVVLGWWLKRGA